MKRQNGKFIAYYRVSTQKQGKSGLGLDAQREAVTQFLNGGSWNLIAEYTEVESGKRSENRPKLEAAMRACKLHDATLVIAKLDRLARNMAFIANLMESKVPFVACDLPDATDLTIHIMAAFAQHEAKAISERTKAALAAAKAKGVKLGTRQPERIAQYVEKGVAASNRARKKKAAKRALLLLPEIEEIRAQGVTAHHAIAQELTRKKIPTPAGKETWMGNQVERVLRAAGAGAEVAA